MQLTVDKGQSGDHHASIAERNLPADLDARLVRKLIRAGKIRFAGNKKLKIYGTLHCSSGKRMKSINRLFFSSEGEAMQLGYRPCGNCLSEQYTLWKNRLDLNRTNEVCAPIPNFPNAQCPMPNA